MALELLTAEKQMLAEEHAKTKIVLRNADERLLAAQSSIAELQRALKGTRTSVGKLRDSVGKMEHDTASRIWPHIEQLGSNLKNLDKAHAATAQSADDNKLFTDGFHRAFHRFQDENDQRNIGHDHKFQQMESSFTQFDGTLKGIQKFTQLQSAHIHNIDGDIGTVRVKLHNLEIAREEAKQRLNENDMIVTDLKVASRAMGVKVAKLNEFYEEANSGEDIFAVVGPLERMLAQNTENIRHLLDTTQDHISGLRKSNNRTTNLEKAISKLQDQTGRVMDRVGMSTAESHTPSDEPREWSPQIEMAFPRPSAPSSSAESAKMPAAVLRAIDKMSLDARQKRIHETMQDHGDELARSRTNLTKTAQTLENTAHRVSVLEGQMQVTQDDVKNLRASLDLSHEYWKGLSRGFKDMNTEANQDGKVLPPRANLVRLPAISRPPSRQHGTTVMSAR